MENKLELKHIACYLPYGLQVQYKGILNGAELKQWENEFSDRYEIEGTSPTRSCPETIIGDKIGFIKRIEFRKNGYPSFLIGNKVGKRYYDLDGVKPLLHPLSDLYKEIDGKVGIVELAKIATSDIKSLENLSWTVEGRKDKYAAVRIEYDEITFDYDGIGAFWINKRDVYDHSYSDIDIHSQFDLFTYLFSHHYDVFDLHSKGLCIYKNEI